MKHTSLRRAIGLLLSIYVLSHLPLVSQQPQEDLQRRKDYGETMAVMGSVMSNVSNFFVDTVQLSTLRGDAMNYMLQQLDPYTMYMDAEETKAFAEGTQGFYGGIGAILRQYRDSLVVIDAPMKGMPADKAGLRAGDIIWRIDGRTFHPTKVAEVRKVLRGMPHTPVTLTVRRPGYERDSLTVTFDRESVEMNPVAYSELLTGKVGYIQLTTFSDTAHKDLLKAYDQLTQEAGGSMSGLIIDLRGNGGGVMQQAIQICSLFLPKGREIVSLRGRYAEQSKSYPTTAEPLSTTLPLVVLIDDNSASASEIVAGALQDYDRAVIVGRKSYGKGLVQSTLDLPDGGLLKLTTSRYYIPSGRSIQRIDYNHKGGAEAITATDSLGTPYHTTGGRVVYAAGGIMPDVVCESDSVPGLLGTLLLDDLTYDFITDYVVRHPKAPRRIRGFDMGDAEFEAFCRKVEESKFELKSYADALVDKVAEALKAEMRYTELEETFLSLQKTLKADTPRLMKTYEQFIRDYINMNIIARYHYDRGRLMHAVPRDKMIQRALTLLATPSEYAKLLTPAHTSTNK